MKEKRRQLMGMEYIYKRASIASEATGVPVEVARAYVEAHREVLLESFDEQHDERAFNAIFYRHLFVPREELNERLAQYAEEDSHFISMGGRGLCDDMGWRALDAAWQFRDRYGDPV